MARQALGFLLLASVEFDDLLLLEELGEVFSLGKSDDLASEVLHIGLKINRNCGAFVVVGPGDCSAHFSVTHFNDIANAQLVAANVDNLAVNRDVAVGNKLSSLEDRLRIAEAPHNGGESQLKESKEVEAGIAVHPLSSLKGVAKLLLKHVVIASDDLLR